MRNYPRTPVLTVADGPCSRSLVCSGFYRFSGCQGFNVQSVNIGLHQCTDRFVDLSVSFECFQTIEDCRYNPYVEVTPAVARTRMAGM